MRRTKTTSLVAALGLTLTLGTGAAIVPSMGAAQAAPAAEVSISGLEVNHLVEPEGVFGIDDPKPVFCWGFDSNVVGSKQESYRIEVATTPAFNANKVVWDSGVVNSDETTDITYGSTGTAKALRPETDYYWRVTAVDNRGVSTTSETGKFATGLMNGKIGAWDGAQWVGNDDVRLDAKSTMMFDVNAKFTINSGDNASFIFGANDPAPDQRLPQRLRRPGRRELHPLRARPLRCHRRPGHQHRRRRQHLPQGLPRAPTTTTATPTSCRTSRSAWSTAPLQR